MGDFACFCLYFEVNAFKRIAASFIIPVVSQFENNKGFSHK
jgi:hypothetical protein